MYLPRNILEPLVFSGDVGTRFTQNSPVMPDVWFLFGSQPHGAHDLLIDPNRMVQPAELAEYLRRDHEGVSEVAFDERHVVARFSFAALIRVMLPISSWWSSLESGLVDQQTIEKGDWDSMHPELRWFLRLVGTLAWVVKQEGDGMLQSLPDMTVPGPEVLELLEDMPSGAGRDLVWTVSRNRQASLAVAASCQTIKADAAIRLFSLDCSHLAWAILDSGIDATHPAFRRRDDIGEIIDGPPLENSRVVATYDFTRVRQILEDGSPALETLGESAAELRRRLRSGTAIDWSLLEPFLVVPHDENYSVPGHAHGTHVAGILGSDWRVTDPEYAGDEDADLRGVCPDIRLYDFRVFDDSGVGDEFSIIAALQFIRYLNARSNRDVIQGANLSLSIHHDVANYACGRTPVCDETERLSMSGCMVVVAAGNEGYTQYLTHNGSKDAFRNISITDPGNAESVITVGATHRKRPHTYGVSYFSSRGPTGDGRCKPDLIAPGEKILAPLPNGDSGPMDGTSMAAPHVSGAAALLISRHPEFRTNPEKVKEILMSTATDLGRERYFQGAGLIDICRALQSV